MPEQIRKILDKIIAWWRNFSSRQKAIIISATAVVLITLVILIIAVTRTKYISLIHCEDATQSAAVQTLLDDNNIAYRRSTDGMSYEVSEKQYGAASILLGSNDIATDGYTISDALTGSFTTTESDKQKTYKLYLEKKFEDILETLSNVSEAEVTLNIPDDDGTLISRAQDTYVAVKLTLSGRMDEAQAASLAKFLATQVGNDTTDCVSIIDQDSNALFTGGESSTTAGLASSVLSIRQKYEEQIRSEVANVIKGTEVYDTVTVGLNLDMDFSNSEITDLQYYVADEMTQGYLDSESYYESSAVGGAAAVPGTDANDETTYMLEDNDYTESSVTDYTKDYLPNQRLTKTSGGSGKINYANSSITVVATTYHNYSEEALKADGTLDNMTFEEFIAQNSEKKLLEVDPSFYSMVATATGFDTANISIVAYEVPMFTYKTAAAVKAADILQILLAVLIFALLGYVVWRATRVDKVEELEPELSVESLLESTRELDEAELDEIEFQEKSDARLLIEKFVDEKPEAVASLLRNWLNEDWD